MDLLPISALNHLLYCERRAALVHIEQAWSENQFTVEGNVMHEKAHDGPDETKAGVRLVRGLPVKSEALGLSGQCDVVEFHADGVVLPIEYKRGRPKAHRADEVQLCAQAMCLEEMLRSRAIPGPPLITHPAIPGPPLITHPAIPGPPLITHPAIPGPPMDETGQQCPGYRIAEGRLFYGQTRRRLDVVFDAKLRALTADTARRLREMIASRRTPPAVHEERKCEACSLKELCMPQAMRFQKGAAAWFSRQMAELAMEGRAAGPPAAVTEPGALRTTRPT